MREVRLGGHLQGQQQRIAREVHPRQQFFPNGLHHRGTAGLEAQNIERLLRQMPHVLAYQIGGVEALNLLQLRCQRLLRFWSQCVLEPGV